MSRLPAEFDRHPAGFPGGIYRAHCRLVVDGDTLDTLIDLGFNQYAYHTIRVDGVNTPELRSRDAAEKVRGGTAKARTAALVEGKPIVLRVSPDPTTFGRYVAEVWYREGEGWRSLGETLIREGHAVRTRPAPTAEPPV
jgi:micrococcal nuclease